MKDDGSYDLREALEDLEDELIASMKRNLARHEAEEEKEGFRWEMWQKAKLRRLKEFREDNQRIIEEYKPRVKDVIWDTIKNAYAKGKSIIKSLLSKLSISFPKGNVVPLMEEPPPERDFFGINRARIEVLQSEAEEPVHEIQEQVQSDMDRATSAMWRRMDDVYRKTIYKAGIFLNAGGMSLNQAIDQATKDFLAKGIDCIEYKNGNRVNIASYAEMALRTAAHRATLAAEGKERDRLGIHTVIVSAHANTCELCAPWQAKILVDDVFSSGTAEEARELGYPLLSEAIKAGLLHPNCRHTITTYIPGVTQIPKIPDEKKAAETYSAEQKQRALERKIRKWKRIAEGSLDEKNIKAAKNKLNAYRKELRELLADHPELRRDYSREKTRGIGDVSHPESQYGYENFDKTHLAKNESELLPDYKQAQIPDSKIVGYALNRNHPVGVNKAIAFEKHLGYNLSNSDKLIDEIRKGLARYKASARAQTKYGQPYEVSMVLKGANGQYAKVKSGWIVDEGSNFPRMTTVYVDE